MRKVALIEHRQFMLVQALDLLARGVVKPNYVTLRANKLKEVIKGLKRARR